MTSVNLQASPGLADAKAAGRPDEYTAGRLRVLHGAVRWYAAPVCAVFSHRAATTPWSRWACGWDREVSCGRCGRLWHEHTRLPGEQSRQVAR
jgi:hypothetical protein